ncbi:hypothetical protein [Legionella nagasakiensis]|uniref:hypothetical protein n=1 Tax=Legionella nagasakiensis TaxID=535290 RepID=UPI0010546AA4|nr:hypothetical protein [Legionella nagasakiensis]
MTVRVLSFDFDGCLFNEAYCDAPSDNKNIITHNQAFLERIKAENQDFRQITAFIGSNRQSCEIDRVCTTEFKGSCFPEISIICDHLGIEFDPLLLADICGDLPDGTSYARAMDKEYTGEHSSWVFDLSKLTILYAQIHKMANKHSDEPIVFDFYDDKGMKCRDEADDLLEYLHQFFKTYPQLLPANVTLRLNHYAGDDITPYESIQGTGNIDPNYRQTILDMIHIASKKAQEYPDIDLGEQVSCTDFVTPELLTIRAQQRILITRSTELLEEKITQLRRQLDIAYNLQDKLLASLAGFSSTEEELWMQLAPPILAARDQLKADSIWREKMDDCARRVSEFAPKETAPSIRKAAASGILVFTPPQQTPSSPPESCEAAVATAAPASL